MKQSEALGHVAHSGGSLYVYSGWRGHKYLVCREDGVTIGMPMLDRLLVRNDLELVSRGDQFLKMKSEITLHLDLDGAEFLRNLLMEYNEERQRRKLVPDLGVSEIADDLQRQLEMFEGLELFG